MIWLGLLAGPLQAAETDFQHLTQAERSVLGQELRQTLLHNPDIVARALRPAPTFQDNVQADHDRLTQLGPSLWANPVAGPAGAPKVAILLGPGCAACEQMTRILTEWAKDGELQLHTLPLESDAARALGLDTAPSYVFETMIVRGDVPEIALRKYLRR
ncbi:hypothetical protein ACSSNL_13180 [Thalassobius sp. S69A]|uniref:hypothetical protein n=1 Tax=unclassified Thalassovita TaxID=2619711 RepID=UPI000C0FD08B|nr:hypothetical protein [Paracoccaceae bacterium]MBT24804.1 hypothetical protein [Paracoccaceae bacterium]